MQNNSFLGNLKGNAFITGAAGGIGQQCAISFAKLGAKLYLVDRDMTGLEQAKQNILKEAPNMPAQGIFLESLDLTNTTAIEPLFANIKAKMGTIHFAINCAGILGPDYTTPLHELPPSHWDLVLGINLKAQAILTGHEAKLMLENNPLDSQLEANEGRPAGYNSTRGVILHLGSIASQHARSHSGAPYIASKHGLVGLTKVTAVTYGPQGIRCNLIAPGFVDTPLVASMQSTINSFVQNNVPIGRTILPQEVADLAVFLCSERAASITGTTINVDGGSNAK